MRLPTAKRRPSPGFTPSVSLGFSLIEVIVVIAVLSILASMAVPLAAKVIDQSRTEATRKQMEEIHKLIVGDPALGTAGFVGDMGRLPQGGAQPLSQLSLSSPQSVGFLGVRMGYWGPYVNSGFSQGAYLKDAWGTDYVYNAGQITSRGPDHQPAGGDDITYPPSAVNINGRLLINLYVWDGTTYVQPAPAAYPGVLTTVDFYYSYNGVQQWATATQATPGQPPYRFGSAAFGDIDCRIGGPPNPRPCTSGLHAVMARCTLPGRPQVSGQAVVFVPGNDQQAKLDLYLK